MNKVLQKWAETSANEIYKNKNGQFLILYLIYQMDISYSRHFRVLNYSDRQLGLFNSQKRRGDRIGSIGSLILHFDIQTILLADRSIKAAVCRNALFL